jgi:hypothetical protein
MAKNGQIRDKKRNVKRSALTGRIVNGRDVILVDEAFDYIKKLGYRIIPMKLTDHIKTLTVVFLCFASLILLMSLSSGQPFQQDNIYFEQGWTIVDNPQRILEQNQNYQVNFFVYNTSNGALIDETIVNCSYFLADNNGNLIFSGEVDFIDGFWQLDLLGGNFSRIGEYSYSIRCKNGNLGGALSSAYEVRSSGIFGVKPSFLPYLVGIGVLIIGALLWFSLYPFASITTIILGFVLLVNQVNILFSFIVISLGVYIAFKGGNN